MGKNVEKGIFPKSLRYGCFSQSDPQKGYFSSSKDHSKMVFFRDAGRTCLPKKCLSAPRPLPAPEHLHRQRVSSECVYCAFKSQTTTMIRNEIVPIDSITNSNNETSDTSSEILINVCMHSVMQYIRTVKRSRFPPKLFPITYNHILKYLVISKLIVLDSIFRVLV